MAYERACALDEIQADQALAVTLGRYDIAIARDGDEVFAVENVCSHAEVALSEGAGGLGQLADGIGDPARQRGGDDDGETECKQTYRDQQPCDVVDRRRPVRIRIGQRDLDRIAAIDRSDRS